MGKYKNLFTTVAIFKEDTDLSNEQVFYFLDQGIKNGYINQGDLKLELNKAISDNDFDWLKLAIETELLIDPKPYNNKELINYVKGWLWDYLYPEKQINSLQIIDLGKEMTKILRNYSDNEGWMFSYDLFEEFRKQEKFKDLEYYNLWKIPFDKLNIARKPIKEKSREIGYLRHKVNGEIF